MKSLEVGQELAKSLLKKYRKKYLKVLEGKDKEKKLEINVFKYCEKLALNRKWL